MSTRLQWLGHACLLFESGGKHVLIDPFLTGNPKAAASASSVPADLILISHGHGDHVGDAVSIANRTGAKVLTNYEIAEWLKAGKPVTLEFDIRNYFKKGPIKLYNVIADIPGTEKPDEYVIIGGHIDSWDGATGAYLVVDRAEDMFFVVMQDSPSGRMHVITTIKKIIYDAFEK